jgi:uncharacterized metal-binding protein YceD (DUF177 family)
LEKFKEFDVDLVSLSNKQHDYQYVVDNSFFALFENSLVQVGTCKIKVELNKSETMLICYFDITGTIQLTCDRSLDLFDYPIQSKERIIFKYGEETKELSDEIIVIPRDLPTLNVAQFIYEFIGLCVPIKKLHPRYLSEQQQDDDLEDNGILVYSSENSEEEETNKNEEIDPRWEDLKKLIK